MRLQQRFASHHTTKSSNSQHNTKAKTLLISTMYRAYITIPATSASRDVTEGTGERNSDGKKNEKDGQKDRSLSLSLTQGIEGAKGKGKKERRRRGEKKNKKFTSRCVNRGLECPQGLKSLLFFLPQNGQSVIAARPCSVSSTQLLVFFLRPSSHPSLTLPQPPFFPPLLLCAVM